MVINAARAALLERFRWEGGHADVWRVFVDSEAFAAVVAGLVEPWRDRRVTRVLGIESRGFLLGGAASLALGVGFVAVRKSDGLLPGPKLAIDADEDYRGRRHQLRMQAVLDPDDRVLMVDDWAERGSQALAAQHLVQTTGVTFLGLTILVDQMTTSARSRLNAVTALVTADELGPATWAQFDRERTRPRGLRTQRDARHFVHAVRRLSRTESARGRDGLSIVVAVDAIKNWIGRAGRELRRFARWRMGRES